MADVKPKCGCFIPSFSLHLRLRIFSGPPDLRPPSGTSSLAITRYARTAAFLALDLHNYKRDFTKELEMDDFRHEIETHPALLGLLAAVVRENGYSVQYSLKWGFQWVEVSQDSNTQQVPPRDLFSHLLASYPV